MKLAYKSCWHAPGYRDLRLALVDLDTGEEHGLPLPPKHVQRVIFDCALAAQQIGAGAPLDWKEYPVQIVWPKIFEWCPGPKPQPASAAAPVKGKD